MHLLIIPTMHKGKPSALFSTFLSLVLIHCIRRFKCCHLYRSCVIVAFIWQGIQTSLRSIRLRCGSLQDILWIDTMNSHASTASCRWQGCLALLFQAVDPSCCFSYFLSCFLLALFCCSHQCKLFAEINNMFIG